MPPSAPAIDSAATRTSFSSPRTSSRLSSTATRKKNSVMAASLIQSLSERANSTGPARSPMGVTQTSAKKCAHGELARTSAATAAAKRTAPPRVSVRKKRASGIVSLSTNSRGSLARSGLSSLSIFLALTGTIAVAELLRRIHSLVLRKSRSPCKPSSRLPGARCCEGLGLQEYESHFGVTDSYRLIQTFYRKRDISRREFRTELNLHREQHISRTEVHRQRAHQPRNGRIRLDNGANA